MESTFRVVEFDGEDVLLTDITKGLPVFVEEENENYTEDLCSKVDELQIGNKVEAEIRSESVTQQDDFWQFLSINILERTRFYFIEDADSHPEIASNLLRKAENTRQQMARKPFKNDGEVSGYISAVPEEVAESFWQELKGGFRSHEKDLAQLSEISSPPHEVIYSRKSTGDLIFYHLAEPEMEMRSTILTANT